MITCPACSLQLPATARFCGRCGTALASAPAAPQDTQPLPAADPTQVFAAPLAPADPVFDPVDQPFEPATQQFEPDPPAQPTAPAAGAPAQVPAAGAAQAPAFPGPPTGPAFTGPPPPAPGGPLPGGSAPRRRSSIGLVLGIIGGVLALLVAVGVAFTIWLGHDLADSFNQVASQATSTPQAEPTPGGTADETPYTPPGDTVEDTPSDTPSDSPTEDVTPLTVPAGGKMCDTDPSGSAYATAATGNDHTSCEFASAVRDAYESVGGDGSSITTVTAHSPITDKDYDMTCESSPGSGPVTCTGGNDAVVVLGTRSSPGAN